MRRGDICTVSGGPGYSGKPRPSVIIQADAFETGDALTICGFTTQDIGSLFFRIAVQPTELNGLRVPSWLMIDKISAVPRAKIGAAIGRLSDAEIAAVNQAIIIFLGLAAPDNKVDRR